MIESSGGARARGERPVLDKRALIHLVLLTIVGFLFWTLAHALWLGVFFWSLAGAVLVLGLAAPAAQRTLLDLAEYLGKVLGHTIAVIGMTLVFFTVFAAGALWLRLRGRDPMNRAFGRGLGSNWLTRQGDPVDTVQKPYSHPHDAPERKAGA